MTCRRRAVPKAGCVEGGLCRRRAVPSGLCRRRAVPKAGCAEGGLCRRRAEGGLPKAGCAEGGCAEGYQRQAAAETDDTATARYGLSYIVTHFSRMTSASLCFGSTCETRRPSNGEWNYISVGSLILSPPSSSSPSTRIRRSSSSVLPLCSPSRGPPRPDAPLPLRSWSARRRCVFSRRVRARSSRPYMFHWHVGCAGPFFARWSPLWSSPCIRPLHREPHASASLWSSL